MDDARSGEGARHVWYTEGQKQALQSMPDKGPVDMLNFIRLYPTACYEKGSGFEDKGWTGMDAYTEYNRAIGPLAASLGIGASYRGKPLLTAIGPETEQWDLVFSVRYPSPATFVEFTSHPDYVAQEFHRTAGVADSRLYMLGVKAK